MVELRWLKRDPVPEGEAQCVLQFRESTPYILYGALYHTFNGCEWQAVPVVVEGAPILNGPDSG